MNPVDPRAAELMQRHLDGTCTPQETRELSALLKDRPDLATELFESARVHGWMGEALPRADDRKGRPKRRPRHGIPFWIGSVAAALVAGFFTVDALKRHPMPATAKTSTRAEEKKSPDQVPGKGQAGLSADDPATSAELLKRSVGADGIFEMRTADRARNRASAEAEAPRSEEAWSSGKPAMEDAARQAGPDPAAPENYARRGLGSAAQGRGEGGGMSAGPPSASVRGDVSVEVRKADVLALGSDRVAAERETRGAAAAREFLQTHHDRLARNGIGRHIQPKEVSDGNIPGVGAASRPAGKLAAEGRGDYDGQGVEQLSQPEAGPNLEELAVDGDKDHFAKKGKQLAADEKPSAPALADAGLRLLNSRTDSDGTWTGRFAVGQDESVLLEVRIGIDSQAEVRVVTPDPAE